MVKFDIDDKVHDSAKEHIEVFIVGFIDEKKTLAICYFDGFDEDEDYIGEYIYIQEVENLYKTKGE